MFKVYIIQSQSTQRYYTGQSNDVDRRLIQHNNGLNTSTRGKGPWQLVWQSDEKTKSEALVLEKRIKKRGAKRFLEDLKG